MEKFDAVNHPKHYTQYSVECIDMCSVVTRPFVGTFAGCAHGVLKYTSRFNEKNGYEDLLKAQWYLDYMCREIRNMQAMGIPYLNVNAPKRLTGEDADLVSEWMRSVTETLPEKEKRPYVRLFNEICNGRLETEKSRLNAKQALKELQEGYEGKRAIKQTVNHPSHYSGGIECIDFLKVMTAPYNGIVGACTWNALKYTFRAHKKGDWVEDIDKAKWYLNYADKHIEKEQELFAKNGIPPTYRLSWVPQLTRADYQLRDAAYEQVMNGLGHQEQTQYALLFENLKDGKFARSKNCREDAIKSLNTWALLGRKVEDIGFDPKPSGRQNGVHK